MQPGRAPPYSQAEAWPNSWKTSEATVSTKTMRISTGWSRTVRTGSIAPKNPNSHTSMATADSRTATTTAGRCSQAKAAAIRAVRFSSKTTRWPLRASSRSERGTSTSSPSWPAGTVTPSG